MAVKKPLIVNAGKLEEIKSPDTIDPAVLPAAAAGGAVPLTVSGTYSPPVGQTLYRESITVQTGGQIAFVAGATLVKI